MAPHDEGGAGGEAALLAAIRRAIDAAHDLLDEDRAADALAVIDELLVERTLGAASDPPRAPARSPALRAAIAEAEGLAAIALRALGRPGDARARSDRALAHASAALDALGSAPEVSSIYADLLEDRAELELAARAPALAREHLRRALGLRESGACAETWLALAEAEQRAGDPDAAAAALREALDRARSEGDVGSEALALEMEGDVALDRAAPADADEAYARAERAWRALGDTDAVARCLVGRARAAERRDDPAAFEAIARQLDTLGARELAGRVRAGDVD